MIHAAPLSGFRGIRHAFFNREGGVSEGLYASLNCGFGSNDEPENVAANRARAMADIGLPPEALCTVYQCHGAAVLTVDRGWQSGDRQPADGIVTTAPGMALGILTADCAPVLFADESAGVIGAAHAGWKGALAGILDATLDAMIDLGARTAEIQAAVGPCIGNASYEVGADFRRRFDAEDPASGEFFRPAKRSGHQLFDLAGYVERLLSLRGLAVVEVLGRDTHREEGAFFSYRRACERSEPDYGRCLSAIALG